MRPRWRGLVCSGSLLLALSAPAHAQGVPPNIVWYRGSAECPTGPEFLQKLGTRAALAKLADAGDHIDFIVTLVSAAGESVGRLERQTRSGTVAIRELRDASCAQVADAIVLSLGLSLDPDRPPAESREEPSSAPDDAPPPPGAPLPERTDAPVDAPSPPALAPSPAVDSGRTKARRDAHARWSVGAHGGILAGVSPEAMGAVSGFADLEGAFPGSPELSLRAGFVGAFGSTDTAVGPVSRRILAGHLAGCLLRWGAGRWGLRPCIFVDAGATSAESSRETTVRGTTPWVAPGAELRFAVEALPPLGLEAAATAVVPLIRSEVGAGEQRLYRDGSAAFLASIGLFVRLR